MLGQLLAPGVELARVAHVGERQAAPAAREHLPERERVVVVRGAVVGDDDVGSSGGNPAVPLGEALAARPRIGARRLSTWMRLRLPSRRDRRDRACATIGGVVSIDPASTVRCTLKATGGCVRDIRLRSISTIFHGPPIDYAALALAAAASWVGVPGPGEPVLIAAGVFAAQHKLDIASVLIVAWAGATAGGIGGLGARAEGRAGGAHRARGPLHGLRLTGGRARRGGLRARPRAGDPR